jgi:HKD family nuclease
MDNWIYKEIEEANKMHKKGLLFWKISIITLIIGVVSFVFMVLSHCMGW